MRKSILKTKMVCVDYEGIAVFNEKIEMKSTFEYNTSLGQFKTKYIKLSAMIVNGIKLGTVDINLNNYVSPGTYLHNFSFSNHHPVINNKSFFKIKIETFD